MFCLNLDKIDYDNKIGHAGSEATYAYHEKLNKGTKYVVKRIIAQNTEDLLLQIQKIILGFSCDHPNLLSIKGYRISFNQSNRFWEVYMKLPHMEQSLKEKIRQHIREGTDFKEDEIVRHFYSLVLGLEYLHKKKIAHCDINPENILLDNENRLRISDIGAASLIEEQNFELGKQIVKNISYIAPELLNETVKLKKRQLFQADLWSFGVIMAEICLNKLGVADAGSNGKEKEAKFVELLKEIGKDYSSVLPDLILSLLRFNPKERKSLKEVKEVLEKNFGHILKEEQMIEKVTEGDQGELKEKQRHPLRAESFILTGNKRILEEADENTLHNLQRHSTFSFSETGSEKLKDAITNLEQEARKVEKSIMDKENDNMNLKALESLLENKFVIKHSQRSLHIEKKKDASPKEEDFLNLSSLLRKADTDMHALDLHLNSCQKITDHDVKGLAHAIGSNLISLESLKVNFWKCDLITDDGVKELILNVIPNLTNLKHLLLDFSNCRRITDASIEILADTIQSNSINLHQLELNLLNCEKITVSGIKALSDVSSLKEIKLMLPSSISKEKEKVSELKDVFKDTVSIS